MPNKLSHITKDDLLKAFEKIDIEGIPKDHEWNEYWIVHNNHFYPFKYSVTLASASEIDFRSDPFYRAKISALGFNIRFRSEKYKDQSPAFWVGASYLGTFPEHIPMLEDFLRDSYWATDYDPSSVAGAKIYKLLEEVRVNDRIAVRLFSKRSGDIHIQCIGTVSSNSQIASGRLGVGWDYFPYLYSGPKLSGAGSGNWSNALIELKRPEDVEIIFDYPASERRYARLTWNLDNGYISPSGRIGKSLDPNTHEAQFGYGHEEWLFDNTKLINGYHYGFLEPVRKHQDYYRGKTFDVSLYTIDGESKDRFEVGEIFELEVLDEIHADSIKEQYQVNGWLEAMEKQIILSGANEEGFSGFNGVDIFNIRYLPENLRLNNPYRKISKASNVYGVQRYTFTQNLFILAEEENDEESFVFITPFPPSLKEGGEETSEDENPLKKKRYHRKPREIEITFLHDAISKALTKKLRSFYSHHNVHPEHPTGYGQNRIDIVVNSYDGLIFYEIKTYPSISTAIREAFGQLMEYSYWPNKLKAAKLIIVTQIPITEKAAKYFNHLRSTFNLPIYYQSFDLKSGVLSVII